MTIFRHDILFANKPAHMPLPTTMNFEKFEKQITRVLGKRKWARQRADPFYYFDKFVFEDTNLSDFKVTIIEDYDANSAKVYIVSLVHRKLHQQNGDNSGVIKGKSHLVCKTIEECLLRICALCDANFCTISDDGIPNFIA